MTDCHVEKFLHMRNVKKIYHIEKALHMILEQNVCMRRNLSCGEMFPHDRLLHMNQLVFFFAKSVLSQFTLLLSRNLFCSDLRAFVWRKVEPKTVRVEKKRQISGMGVGATQHAAF